MRRAIPFVALTLVIAWPIPADDGEESTVDKGLLPAMIELEESTEKQGVLPLGFGVEPQDVDINSTIRIHVSADELTKALEKDTDIAKQISPQVAELVEISAQLRKSVVFMEDAVAQAAELARVLAGGGNRSDAGFKAAADGLQASNRGAFEPLKPYWSFLGESSVPSYRRHGKRSFDRANAAILAGPGKGRTAFLQYLVEEVDWVVGELDKARSRAASEPPSMALVLSAVHSGKEGTRQLGLPNYNQIEIGAPVRFEKVSLVPSPEQLAEIRKLRGEAENLADALDPLLTDGLSELQDSLGGLGGSLGFGQVQTAFDAVKSDVEALQDVDWSSLADEFQSALETALTDAVGDDVELLQEFRSDLEGLLTRLQEFGTELFAIVEVVDSLSGGLPDFEEGTDSIDFLTELLGTIEGGAGLVSSAQTKFRDLLSEAQQWIDDVKSLGDKLREIQDSLLNLPEDVSFDLETILGSVDDDTLSSLATDIGQLRDAVRAFIRNLRNLKNDNEAGSLVQLASDIDDLDPPETSFPVRLDTAKDTWIDIQTVNPRQEGDALAIRAWLYRVAAAGDNDDGEGPDLVKTQEVLDRAVQNFRIFRFGWYNAPSVGLTYLSSFDKIPEPGAIVEEGEEPPPGRPTEGFVPQVSWMFRHRSWNKDCAKGADGEVTCGRQTGDVARYRPSWMDNMGLGFHTVALDLDNDNQMEVGFGVTVSFLNDFLQLGVGVDLSLDEEPYFFLGTRLFNLAQGLGIKSSQAPGDDDF